MASDRDVMLRFESVGENCEFGIAQRLAGAEPISLLRWSATPLPRLMTALQNKFAGFGDSIAIEAPEAEWFTTDLRYGWKFHTWTERKNVPYDEMLAREQRRFPFLRHKLLSDLTDATKIFVYKRPSISNEEAASLHDTLCEYGPNRLLCVTQGNEPVRFLRADLVCATIPKFAHAAIVDKDTDGAAWLALCKSVLSHFETAFTEYKQCA